MKNLYQGGTVFNSLWAKRPLKDKESLLQIVREDKELLSFANSLRSKSSDINNISFQKYIETQQTTRNLLTERPVTTDNDYNNNNNINDDEEA